MMDTEQAKTELVAFMHRLYEKNLTTTSGGNISLKVSSDRILLTPSKVDKARLQEDQIVMMDLNGYNFTPHVSPSVETNLHLQIYRQYEGVSAIIHAHPMMASAFTAMNRRINTRLIAEARVVLGEPVNAPYALMGSDELAHNVAQAFAENDVVLMENHGVATVGRNLLEAFDRIEVLENAARMTYVTETMGDKKEMTDTQVRDLDQLL